MENTSLVFTSDSKKNQETFEVARAIANYLSGNERSYCVVQKNMKIVIDKMLSNHRYGTPLSRLCRCSVNDVSDEIATDLYTQFSNKDNLRFRELAGKSDRDFIRIVYSNSRGNALNKLKKNNAYSSIFLTGTDADDINDIDFEDNESTEIEIQDQIVLEDALGTLTKQERCVADAIIAAENQGLKHKDIAKKLGMTTTAFNKYYFTAMQKLKSYSTNAA